MMVRSIEAVGNHLLHTAHPKQLSPLCFHSPPFPLHPVHAYAYVCVSMGACDAVHTNRWVPLCFHSPAPRRAETKTEAETEAKERQWRDKARSPEETIVFMKQINEEKNLPKIQGLGFGVSGLGFGV